MKPYRALLEQMKTSSLFGDFPPLVEGVNICIRFIEKTEMWSDRKLDNIAAVIKDKEEKLELMRNLRKSQEKQQDEL